VLLLGQAAMVALISALPTNWGLLAAGGLLEPGVLAEALQRNYGSPGNDHFTAAFDLAQYKVFFIIFFCLYDSN
jgi:hypothetical protein